MANTHSLDLELSSSQYASIADGSQTGLDLSTDFTLEAWINVEQLPSTATTTFEVFGKKDTNNQYSYYMSINTSDIISVRYSSDGTLNNSTVISSDAAIVTAGDVGSWVHIAASMDISASDGVIYKNGSAVAHTPAGTETAIHDGTSAFAVGCAFATGTAERFFDGKIDEVRVWSDIRSEAEISDNYESELDGDEAGLVAYYKLNNDYTDSQSSGNNDLTASGSPVFSTGVPFGGLTGNFLAFL